MSERATGRTLAVAGLLAQGWTATEVARGLDVLDKGGSPDEAMAAMEAFRQRHPSAVSVDGPEGEPDVGN